ncbi:hypothetical protein [Sphingomonas gellani]|uniref:hypothetical protein n=1 Tax=Sphingomonas gellani TaxID=1166340 RepID=UPI000B83DECF|nr:hypothetical protein [Sphingomonas gellani]
MKRGESDPACLSTLVATLLRDLFRYHVVMNFQAPLLALQEGWVDTLFLPLLRPAGYRKKK